MKTPKRHAYRSLVSNLSRTGDTAVEIPASINVDLNTILLFIHLQSATIPTTILLNTFAIPKNTHGLWCKKWDHAWKTTYTEENPRSVQNKERINVSAWTKCYSHANRMVQGKWYECIMRIYTCFRFIYINRFNYINCMYLCKTHIVGGSYIVS